MWFWMTAAILALATAFVAPGALGHPGSGIVVDGKGQVFFTDHGRGVWKIDARGKLTLFHDTGWHWMAIDEAGAFSQSTFREWFQRITPPGFRPAILIGSDFPFVVSPDGHLCYAPWTPEGLQIRRMTPDGKVSILTDGRGGKPGGKGASPKFGGVTGMACSPDGSLYVTDGRSLRKITLDGTVSTRVGEIVVKECAHDEGAQVPFVRGLAVDPRGAVYGAATGCRCVIKITPDGSVTTVLKAERPWAPIGVAVRDGDLYVLEHNNPAAEGPRDGVPRVRKMGRDGKVITLATVSREKEPAQR